MSNPNDPKLEIASNLISVTGWLPDSTEEEFVTFRRVFVSPRDDGSQQVIVLFACVDEQRSFVTMFGTDPDYTPIASEVRLDTGDGHLAVYVRSTEHAGQLVTTEALTDLLNQAVRPYMPLALEDSITLEDVEKARQCSTYDPGDDADERDGVYYFCTE